MKKELKLSIITINYNNKAGLIKTVESVAHQTYQNYEYIVIDGGSTDGSVEYIQDMQEHFAHWISEPDSGIYNAMNKGIKAAKGQYCMFLNSGDWLCSNSVIQEAIDLYIKEDIVYGNMFKVYPDGTLKCDKGPQRDLLTLGDMYFSTINHSSSFIKRELFTKFGLYKEEYQIVSDWAFFLKVIGLERVKVKYIDLDINYFDMTGISNKQLKKRYKEKETELKKVMPIHLRPDYEKMAIMGQKARIYDALKTQFLLWNIIRVYNKLFGRPLW